MKWVLGRGNILMACSVFFRFEQTHICVLSPTNLISACCFVVWGRVLSLETRRKCRASQLGGLSVDDQLSFEAGVGYCRAVDRECRDVVAGFSVNCHLTQDFPHQWSKPWKKIMKLERRTLQTCLDKALFFDCTSRLDSWTKHLLLLHAHTKVNPAALLVDMSGSAANNDLRHSLEGQVVDNKVSVFGHGVQAGFTVQQWAHTLEKARKENIRKSWICFCRIIRD